MQFEHESSSPRYWLCTVGFWVAGLSLALLSLSGALMLWIVLTLDQGLFLAMQQPWFTWGVELPITAGALIGGTTTGSLAGAAVGGAIGATAGAVTGQLLGRYDRDPNRCVFIDRRTGERYLDTCPRG